MFLGGGKWSGVPDLLLMIETGPVSDQSGAVLGWGNDKGGFLMRGERYLNNRKLYKVWLLWRTDGGCYDNNNHCYDNRSCC